MENFKDKTAIVGIGYTEQGKIPGRSALSFHIEAIKNAIEDAGLKKEDIEREILDLKLKLTDISKHIIDLDMENIMGSISNEEFEEKHKKLKTLEESIKKKIQDYEQKL